MNVPDHTAAADDKLLDFIRVAKAEGLNDNFVVRLLKHNGWSERAVFQAFSSYYNKTLPLPVPSRGAGIENARDAFFYLLAFITLGIWAFALGNLFYNVIDRAFNDPLTAGYMTEIWRSNISYDLASIMIAFPIFLWMTWIVQHEALQRPEVLDSGVRKWLTYLALVITASCLIGDAVMFLQAFLHGSLTEVFVLKSLVLILIAGGIFVYYLGAVRAETAAVRRDQVFAALAVAAVLAGILVGFLENGTPAAQRLGAFDARRVSDLQRITQLLRSSWNPRVSRQLPVTLNGIYLNSGKITDPQTHRVYEYHVKKGSVYQLCADFDTNTMNDAEDAAWRHPAGHYCFVRDAAFAPDDSP